MPAIVRQTLLFSKKKKKKDNLHYYLILEKKKVEQVNYFLSQKWNKYILKNVGRKFLQVIAFEILSVCIAQFLRKCRLVLFEVQRGDSLCFRGFGFCCDS